MTAATGRAGFTERAQNIPAGIGLMVLAIFLFSVNDALGKWLAATYAAPQILLFRSVAASIVLVPVIGRIGFRSLIDVERPRLQAIHADRKSTRLNSSHQSTSRMPSSA